ncbi:MAG: hypothetical protein KJT03_09640 [Verrucomicrobiae bacterium]|nr:hypothetical protein [Verrucomicrobiae bacterium]
MNLLTQVSLRIPSLLVLTSLSGLFFPSPVIAETLPYPPVSGLAESNLYSVTVDGKKIWTEHFVSNLDFDKLPDWFNEPDVRKPQELHLANFSGTGYLKASVTFHGDLEDVRIRPLSRGITPKIDGNQITFNWEGPGQLVVEVGDAPPLFLFANPEEENVPSPSDPGIKYFGPGIHRPGYIELKDNESVYIATGAVVYGGIRANNASNIKVFGRGILDGNYEHSRMVLIEDSRNILFEGVTIRNGRSWTNTLVNCRDVEYRNVKVLGFGPSSDGINPAGSQRVKISHCFLRNTDDCIAIKAPDYAHPVRDVLVENNIMIGYAYADGITIGFETNAQEVSNVTVKDCDILKSRGGSRVDGHSGFSIICDGPAVIHDILFENIRVERADVKLFELNITDGKQYGEDPPGHIRDVTIRNVAWLDEGPIVLAGFDKDHIVKNVVFEDCTIADKPLKEMQEAMIKMNAFVENVTVSNN